MDTIRLGIVGLGNIASQHIDNVNSGQAGPFELTAVCSRTRTPYAENLGVQHFAKQADLYASGLCDAVLIATPTFDHLHAGKAALDAGLHVMMEKPIGLSLAEGEQLLAAKSDDQIFALMLNQRSDPLFVAMREHITAGTLGEITRTHWTMTNWFRPEVYFQVSEWRATWKGEGGGLLVNQCIHNLDIFQWLCGMPESVWAECAFGRYHDIEVEDEATALLKYHSGATGLFVGSTGEAPGVNRFDIIGDRGSLNFDGQRLSLTRNSPATGEFSRNTKEMFGVPDATTEDITPDRDINQHAAVMRNFAAAIQRDEPLLAAAEEGLNSLALANAMLLSSWESREVTFPLDAVTYQQALDQRIDGSALRKRADIEANIDMGASYR
ncbi:Gfo/Idh/MocA family oxidoreductase [Halioglobus maricola]|uniref:Gfo/Idh/MocA family oxidoreductase n=1 Tax=Halioglobus maricola TaxID=2601894 RepID=A0A5P9NJA6_9GAMM|nr:Gfo/Idh/MocA family oxidoreductase [Halioglobus maricola]QFU75953.1 Gfo/Idh/MocA family oxidoreductase [Halioglobus maricola]